MLSQPLCVTEFTFSPDVGIHFITAVVCFGMGNGSLWLMQPVNAATHTELRLNILIEHTRAHNKCPQWTRRVSDTPAAAVLFATAFIFWRRVRDCKDLWASPLSAKITSNNALQQLVTVPVVFCIAFITVTGTLQVGIVLLYFFYTVVG